MRNAQIHLQCTYQTRTGYQFRVDAIDNRAEEVTYTVVCGCYRDPQDMVGKVGVAKLSAFAKRVEVELPRVLLHEGSAS